MKKLIALLLAALMLLSLAACAAKPAETKTEAPAKTEEPAKTEQPAETEEAPAAAEGKYDVTGLENVTIVFATANAAANIESIYANRFMELRSILTLITALPCPLQWQAFSVTDLSRSETENVSISPIRSFIPIFTVWLNNI